MANKTIDCSTNTYNYLSIKLAISGKELTPFLDSITYGDNQETTAVFGGQSLPIGKVKGKYVAKVDFTFKTRESFQDFLTLQGPGFYEKTFPVIVSYAEAGKKTITDTIGQVQMLGSDLSSSNDGVPVKISTICFGKIKWDGVEGIS